jgi:MYXO-CTERM domain-containing protein
LLTILGASSPAWALKQSEHGRVTAAACARAGLPEDFCDRVTAETYDVDAWEWNDLAAHAQIDDNQTACQAANAARERLRTLGGDVRGLLQETANSSSLAPTGVAVALGRALHTVQDNCAHHGMPNPQHAWWSLSDVCAGTSASPDVQPGAISCAHAASDRVFATLRSAMQQAGVGSDALSMARSGAEHWPSRGDICHFMRTLSQEWDGVDRRWENGVVSPALEAQLVRAMTVDDVSTGDICQGGERSIALARPNPRYDTSNGEKFCFSMSVYCVGKADDVDEPPPWETEAPVQQQEAAGCAVAGDHTGNMFPLVLLLGLVMLRRSARRK